MATAESSQKVVAPEIVRRTDRGLCLAGRRITLYLIMDYLTAGWPPHLLRHWLDLSEAEIAAAMSYIETNREEFEAEYAAVVRNAAERERYWRERNGQRELDPDKRHFTPEQTTAWARLEALRREGRW
jgi:uncharacterized protein (DUF433 family)